MEPIVTKTTLQEGIQHFEETMDINIGIIEEIETSLTNLDSIHPELLNKEDEEEFNKLRDLLHGARVLIKTYNQESSKLYETLLEQEAVLSILER